MKKTANAAGVSLSLGSTPEQVHPSVQHAGQVHAYITRLEDELASLKEAFAQSEARLVELAKRVKP